MSTIHFYRNEIQLAPKKLADGRLVEQVRCGRLYANVDGEVAGPEEVEALAAQLVQFAAVMRQEADQ